MNKTFLYFGLLGICLSGLVFIRNLQAGKKKIRQNVFVTGEETLMKRCTYAKDFGVSTIRDYRVCVESTLDVLKLELEALECLAQIMPIPQHNGLCVELINKLLAEHELGSLVWDPLNNGADIQYKGGTNHEKERIALLEIHPYFTDMCNIVLPKEVQKTFDQYIQSTDCDREHLKQLLRLLKQFGASVNKAKGLHKKIASYKQELQRKTAIWGKRLQYGPVPENVKDAVKNWTLIATNIIKLIGLPASKELIATIAGYIKQQKVVVAQFEQELKRLQPAVSPEPTAPPNTPIEQKTPAQIKQISLPCSYGHELTKQLQKNSRLASAALLDWFVHSQGVSCTAYGDSVYTLPITVQEQNSPELLPLLALYLTTPVGQTGKFSHDGKFIRCNERGIYRFYANHSQVQQYPTAWAEQQTLPWSLGASEIYDRTLEQVEKYQKTCYQPDKSLELHQKSKVPVTYQVTIDPQQAPEKIDVLESSWCTEILNAISKKTTYVWKQRPTK